MRIIVHDYSGHLFPAQLSRALAREGHEVCHVFSASFQTPKGNLVRRDDDPATFRIRPVRLEKPFAKDSLFRRRAQEIETGQRVAEIVAEEKPDVVISTSASLDSQRIIQRQAKASGAKFVCWLQDINSVAIERVVSQKLGPIGKLIGRHYHRMEYGILERSDHIIPITEDFVPILVENGIETSRVSVVENWAPLDEIVPVARDNDWSRENMPHPGLRIVYSGTLGYKHNPQLLIDVARAVDGHVYVFSEGGAASALASQAAELGVANLSVHPWVPAERLSEMFSAADVFIAMIEEDAGIFSVPSKVLGYLCAGKPIAAAIPEKNLARRIIEREQAGVVVNPGSGASLVKAVKPLLADQDTRVRMGRNGRNYALKTFDIGPITQKFEAILADVRKA